MLLCIIKFRKISYENQNSSYRLIILMNWLLTNYKIQYIIQGNTIVEMLENIKNKQNSVKIYIKKLDEKRLQELLKNNTTEIEFNEKHGEYHIRLKKVERFVYIISIKSDEEKVCIVNDKYIDNLHTIVKIMDKLFNKYDISYWLIGGSLIGSLRNTPGGPIKWDDDIDVAITSKDEEKLNKMMKDKDFTTLIEYAPHNWGYQLRLKGDENSIKDFYYDVFIYRKRKGKYGTKWYVEDFPKSYYNDLDEIFPLKKCDFWDMKLPCPNKLNTVHRGYDTNVLKYAEKYNHSYGIDEHIDLYKQINSGDTIPMLSQKLAKKLQFK